VCERSSSESGGVGLFEIYEDCNRPVIMWRLPTFDKRYATTIAWSESGLQCR